MKHGRVPWVTKLRPDLKHDVTRDSKGRGRLLLPTPMLVAQEISMIPAGALMTFPALRTRLARRFEVDLVCPLMTGIFFNIIAGAAEEQLAAGQSPVAPYWRVVRDDGSLSPKTPAGPDRQAEHLRQEGHTVQMHGNKLQVIHYEQRLLE